jgi:hypothetical protein
MAVLFVLFGFCLLCRLLGFALVPPLDSWMVSARVALATMFLFTATSHFAPMKKHQRSATRRAIAWAPGDVTLAPSPLAASAHRVGVGDPMNRNLSPFP